MNNRKKTIQYAFQKSIPIMTGYIVLGMGFGILLQKHDIFRMCGRQYDQLYDLYSMYFLTQGEKAGDKNFEKQEICVNKKR